MQAKTIRTKHNDIANLQNNFGGIQIRAVSFRTKHIIWLGIFASLLVLTVSTFPPLRLVSVLPRTESYFHVLINEELTNYSGGAITGQSNWVIAEGHIRLSGTGGLCVNNVLTMDVKIDLFRNSSAPDKSIMNSPTSIDLHPQFGFQPCATVDVENTPKSFHLYLNESNNWHASGDVEFFDSGYKALNFTFINANLNATRDSPNQVLLVSPEAIQISDESVYVSKVNDDYIVFLSLLVVSLTCLQLRPIEENDDKLLSVLSLFSFRTEEGTKNKPDDDKTNLNPAQNTDENETYPKGRSKYNYGKEKKRQ